ncbi:MAG: hypothetical protein UZ14_CFX002002132 [Chloroflexi bacterium OLB14]|nr:MAG: hypothetical protein UZ14_CFX002002132 [Chloroflexi bacterium OLB14]
MSNILEVKDLKKNYGDFQAVKGVSFEIKDGENFLVCLVRTERGKQLQFLCFLLYMNQLLEMPLLRVIPLRKSRCK